MFYGRFGHYVHSYLYSYDLLSYLKRLSSKTTVKKYRLVFYLCLCNLTCHLITYATQRKVE